MMALEIQTEDVRSNTKWHAIPPKDPMNRSKSDVDGDGVYVFDVNLEHDIGVNVDTVQLQIGGNDALCIDMVAAGNAKYPHLWKGRREPFFVDNPCSVDPIHGVPCYALKSVHLECYDF